MMMWRLATLAMTMMLPLTATAQVIAGADVSSLEQVESSGRKFASTTGPTDGISFLKQNGVTAIRLRLWVDPAGGLCDLESTVALARRAKDAELDVLLDLHLSDTWADPAHQEKPAKWRNLHGAELEKAVREYARETMMAFKESGCPPRWVQVGNEVTGGMLWPDGRLGSSDPVQAEEEWRAFAGLFNAAVDGIREAGSAAKIILHTDKGGDGAGVQYFYERANRHGLKYEIIGLSWYPKFHGGFENLNAALDAAELYFRPIMLVETAYPWTLEWKDNTHNITGDDQDLLTGFAATREGQAEFFKKLRNELEGRTYVKAMFYWEPLWMAGDSPVENQTLVDWDGRALPGFAEFVARTSPASPTPNKTQGNESGVGE